MTPFEGTILIMVISVGGGSIICGIVSMLFIEHFKMRIATTVGIVTPIAILWVIFSLNWIIEV